MTEKLRSEVEAELPSALALAHGTEQLSRVRVDHYNAEMRTADGFVGDRASKRAFQSILDEWRERVAQMGEDPLGDEPSEDIGKKELDKVLLEGDPEAAGMIHSAIEEFAQEFATVIRRFLRLKDWKDVERIVVGGGLRQSRIGELAIGSAAVALKARGHAIEVKPIRHKPDHAGLIGCVHLVPSWILSGHDSILAVDIGGSNIRAGIVELNAKKSDLSGADVTRLELWRHCEDKPKRNEAVERLIDLLAGLMKYANKQGLTLAPFIGIGCPGVIRADGTIERGGQNLPGNNWEAKGFNLPQELRAAIPRIGDHDTTILMHNDAVVQGLSELPWMQDVKKWGVMTIGTGLGNAHFTNREKSEKD